MENRRTILVTGVNGFVGRHLTEALKAQDFRVVGLAYTEAGDDLKSFVDDYFVCDLTDTEGIKTLKLPPVDAAIHLAGLASLAASFDEPQKYVTDNVLMFINLCEKLRADNPNTTPRVVAISSGTVYDPHKAMPLTEASDVAVNSPYVISKLTIELAAHYYQTRGLDCVIARPMNHIGPGQLPGFLVPDLTSQVREALAKNQTLVVGNLKTRRDYTDVRDVVQAYIKLATEKLEHNLYNICSGKSVEGNEILKLIINELAPGKEMEITVDQSRVRPYDPADVYGSLDLINADTGWKPTIPLQQTIHDFLTADSAKQQ